MPLMFCPAFIHYLGKVTLWFWDIVTQATVEAEMKWIDAPVCLDAYLMKCLHCSYLRRIRMQLNWDVCTSYASVNIWEHDCDVFMVYCLSLFQFHLRRHFIELKILFSSKWIKSGRFCHCRALCYTIVRWSYHLIITIHNVIKMSFYCISFRGFLLLLVFDENSYQLLSFISFRNFSVSKSDKFKFLLLFLSPVQVILIPCKF